MKDDMSGRDRHETETDWKWVSQCQRAQNLLGEVGDSGLKVESSLINSLYYSMIYCIYFPGEQLAL